MWGTRRKAGAPGLLGMSNEDMKALLREAGQAHSGDRATLAQRIIDLHLPLPVGTSVESEPVSLYPLPLPCPNGTQVVNLKVEYLRPKSKIPVGGPEDSLPTYQNSKEWCEDPSGNNVYIGRGGPVLVDKVRYPPQSKWRNPFTTKKHGPNVVQLYDAYIRAQPFLDEIEEFRGKQLGCWCVDPKDPNIRCHGHVLIAILNERAGIQTPPPSASAATSGSSQLPRHPAPSIPGIPTLQNRSLSLPPVPRIESLPPIAGIIGGIPMNIGPTQVIPSPTSIPEIVPSEL